MHLMHYYLILEGHSLAKSLLIFQLGGAPQLHSQQPLTQPRSKQLVSQNSPLQPSFVLQILPFMILSGHSHRHFPLMQPRNRQPVSQNSPLQSSLIVHCLPITKYPLTFGNSTHITTVSMKNDIPNVKYYNNDAIMTF